jgi:F-type H+-transporting ATPase subunit b
MEFFQANLNLREVFVQLLAFIIVFWALKTMAWKPLLGLLEARRMKIADGLNEIEKAKQELEKLKADYGARLGHIEEEARSKMQEVVQEGKRAAREIQDSARNQAKDILEKTKEDIQLEAAKARVLLRREIAALAFAAIERLIKEKVTDPKDEQMIEAFIKELEETKEPFVTP